MAIDAHPNGRVSFGRRAVQHGGKRGLHIRQAKLNTIRGHLSKLVKAPLGGEKSLSDSGAVLDWFTA
jgi:hypothetical protein